MKTRTYIYVAVILVVITVIYCFSRSNEEVVKITVEQSDYSPPPSEIPPVNPDESEVLLDDLPVLSVDDDALEIALMNTKKELERQAEKEAIWAAPWQETFEYVTSNPPDIMYILNSRPMVPGAFVDYVHWDLHLSRLLSILDDQNSPEYEVVRVSVRNYCENTFYTLPEDVEYIGDFVPSASYSGLAASMPYLLAHTDKEGDTLPVLIKMQQYHQSINEEKFERDTGMELDGRKVWSNVDYYVYAAGIIVFDDLVESNRNVSPEQLEVIVQYRAWKDNEPESDVYDGLDIDLVLGLMGKF